MRQKFFYIGVSMGRCGLLIGKLEIESNMHVAVDEDVVTCCVVRCSNCLLAVDTLM